GERLNGASRWPVEADAEPNRGRPAHGPRRLFAVRWRRYTVGPVAGRKRCVTAYAWIHDTQPWWSSTFRSGSSGPWTPSSARVWSVTARSWPPRRAAWPYLWS